MKRMIAGAVLAAMAFSAAGSVRADDRKFGYVYEADSVLPKGHKEFEQWLTYRGGKEAGTFRAWDAREELEVGLTDRLTTALYLNFRNEVTRNVPGRNDGSFTKFKGVSSEWKYMLVSPNLHLIGVMPYLEVTVEGDEFELEEKLILQHNFSDRLVWAGNIVMEQEWEREEGHTAEAASMELVSGLSYKVADRWWLGVEGRNSRTFVDGLHYENQGTSAWFAGPTVHYGTGGWWTTLTVLPQVHGTPDTKSGLQLDQNEKLEVRLIGSLFF